MKIYILFIDDEILIFSLPSKMVDNDDGKVATSFIKGGFAINITSGKLSDDFTEEELKEIEMKSSQNRGHDLALPMMMSNRYKGFDNIRSIKKMIENFRTTESANVKDLDFGESGMTGVVITIK